MYRVTKSALIIFTFVLFTVYIKQVFALVPLLNTATKFKIDPKVTSCVIIDSTIQKVLEGFGNSKEKHIETYTILVDRLGQKIEKWHSWGYNTNKLEEDMKNINEMIDKYEQNTEDLNGKLEELKSLCGSDNYKTKLTEVRDALKQLRKDVVDIRVYYQVTVRKDIKELKNQTIE